MAHCPFDFFTDGKKHNICLVGGGGKTTVMYELAGTRPAWARPGAAPPHTGTGRRMAKRTRPHQPCLQHDSHFPTLGTTPRPPPALAPIPRTGMGLILKPFWASGLGDGRTQVAALALGGDLVGLQTGVRGDPACALGIKRNVGQGGAPRHPAEAEMVATIAACGRNTALAHQQDAAVGQHSMPGSRCATCQASRRRIA